MEHAFLNLVGEISRHRSCSRLEDDLPLSVPANQTPVMRFMSRVHLSPSGSLHDISKRDIKRLVVRCGEFLVIFPNKWLARRMYHAVGAGETMP